MDTVIVQALRKSAPFLSRTIIACMAMALTLLAGGQRVGAAPVSDAEVQPDDAARPTGSAGTPAVSRCPSCGANVPKGAQFCAFCGRGFGGPQTEEVTRCPRCQNVVPDEVEQCPTCLLPVDTATLKSIYDEGRFAILPQGRIMLGYVMQTYARERQGFKSTATSTQRRLAADYWAYLHTSLPLAAIFRVETMEGGDGAEKSSFSQGVTQSNKLGIKSQAGHLGMAFPVRLRPYEWAPFLVFMKSKQTLTRKGLSQNGQSVSFIDLTGNARTAVQEKRDMDGIALGLRATYRAKTMPLEVSAWGENAQFPQAKISDEILGNFTTKASMWRLGLTGRYRLTKKLSVGAELDYLLNSSDTTSVKSAGPTQASVLIPGVVHEQIMLSFEAHYSF